MLTLAMLAVALVIAWVLDWRWVVPRLPWFVGAQILAYACGLAVLAAFPAVALALVPRRTKYRQAHDNAMRQFLARNVHLTSARTGVLLFVSMAERYAEVVADAGIDANVAQETWDGVVAELVAQAPGATGSPTASSRRSGRSGRPAAPSISRSGRRRPQRARRSLVEI